MTLPAGDAPRWIQKVRPYVRNLLRWADSGANPELRAELVLDELSQSDVDDLGQHTESPTFLADTFAWVPEIGATPARVEWFTRFLTQLRDSLVPETEAGADEAGAGGVAPAVVTRPQVSTAAPPDAGAEAAQ